MLIFTKTNKVILEILIGFAVLFGLYFLIVVKPQNVALLLDPRQITPVTPLYLVKTSRESLQGMFVFGDLDTAGWELTLADKRIAEAQLLKTRGLETFADQQQKMAEQHQDRAQRIITLLRSDTNVDYLETKFLDNQQKISELRQ